MWKPVGAADAVKTDLPLGVDVDGKQVGIYRIDGTLYAVEDVCPHAYALLTEGFIEGDEVECPLHGALFHIPTGECRRDPGGRDLETFPVKEEDGTVYIDV